MTTRADKAKAEAERLLALREKHKQSTRECTECGKQPLSSKDVLGMIVLANPDTGQICGGCKAILDDVNAEYVVAMPPRGLNSDGAA